MKTPENPYGNLVPDQETVRFQSRIDKADHAFLRGLLVNGTGTVQLIVNTLTKCFVETAKKHGIADYTHRDKLYRLLTTEFPITGRSPASTARGSDSRPNRRRATGVRGKTTSVETEPTNAEGSDKGESD
jgi:hypothetical protein